MKSFKLLNNVLGWLCFAISLFVYESTVEPTTSFWDCGEFIATSYKLQIGHPPGAPLFMMLGRIFSLFASDESRVAYCINMLSATMSAGTILFLFWSITLMGKKLATLEGEEFTFGKQIAVLGSSLVGALGYAFSDTFWFSAVEAEVYAASSFLIALVFWAALRWEACEDESYADRWLVFMAYIMGLSIGIHLLSLLAIPAIGMLYYFKKYEVKSFFHICIAALISVIVLVLVNFVMIPSVPRIAKMFDLLFVNSFGLPMQSGFIACIVLFVAILAFGLTYTRKANKPLWNTAILALTMIMIGYSCYGMTLVRSAANPPMDENDPENPFTLLSYLEREQYGSAPLFHGPYYTAKAIDYKKGKAQYSYNKETKKYDLISDGSQSDYVYDPEGCGYFPRMWSQEQRYIRGYEAWSVEDDEVAPSQSGERPTTAQNLRFFWKLQMGHLYFRYLAWNFIGRQNDAQGMGGPLRGNYKTGIAALDDSKIGTQHNIPTSLKNKSDNSFYGLPLILGLFGLAYMIMRNYKDAIVLGLLFFFLGIAIVLFLNPPHPQPRERDYVFVASFYVFAIWMGLGVYAIFDLIRKYIGEVAGAGLSTVVSLAAAPLLMLNQGYDDHDRSTRYVARDYAINYLQSCAPNAIIFTYGDNDTFPLWYAQEVEGIRADVRVVNLSLLNTDWYINQMKRKAYTSEALPFSIPESKYRTGMNEMIQLQDGSKPMTVQQAIEVVKNYNPEGPTGRATLPTRNFIIPVDTQFVVSNGTVPQDLKNNVESSVIWKIPSGGIMKANLMVLDILANNNWKRPVYFSTTVGPENFMGLENYFQQEGLAYRLVPVRNDKLPRSMMGDKVRAHTGIMYENVMKKFQWGNMDKAKEMSIDENTSRMAMGQKDVLVRLAFALIQEGKKEQAVEVLKKLDICFPEKLMPLDEVTTNTIAAWYNTDDIASGDKLLERFLKSQDEEVTYYNSQSAEYRAQAEVMQEVDGIKRRIKILGNIAGSRQSVASLGKVNNWLKKHGEQPVAMPPSQEQLIKEAQARAAAQGNPNAKIKLVPAK